MRFLLMALLSSIIISAHAEETKPRDGFAVALGGGLFINIVDTDEDLGEDFDDEASSTFNIGARTHYHFNNQWALRSGLYLQEKSARFAYDDGIFDGDLDFKVISGSIPVNVQYSFNDKVSLFGGYSADVKINEYCTTTGNLKNCSLKEDAKSVVHHANLGVSIWGNDKIEIDLSYQHALSEIVSKLKVHSYLAQIFFKL